MFYHLLNKYRFLITVHPFYSLKDIQVIAGIFAGPYQGLHILWKTTATISNPRVQELAANAAIRPYSLSHMFNVSPNSITQVGHCIDKTYLGGKNSIGSILGHFSRLDIHNEDRFTRPHKGIIEFLHYLCSPHVICTDHNPVRSHKVINGSSLFKELRI